MSNLLCTPGLSSTPTFLTYSINELIFNRVFLLFGSAVMLEGLRTAFCLMCPPVPLGDFTLLFTSSGDWGTSDGFIARSLNGLPRTGCPYSIRENEYSPSLLSVYPTSYVPFFIVHDFHVRRPHSILPRYLGSEGRVTGPHELTVLILSGNSYSHVLTDQRMSEAFSCGHTGVSHGSRRQQDAQVLDGASQAFCLYLAVQVAFSCGRSGKSWQARALTRSLICFWTSRDFGATAVFRACSVKLQLLWICSFPCSRDDSCAWSTCRGHRRKER